MKSYSIACIDGDGIGPEIVSEAKKVCQAAGKAFGFEAEFQEAECGTASFRKSGAVFPPESLEQCRKADAVIKGPVGTPDLPPGIVEEMVLGMRQEMDLYVNLRPVKLFQCLRGNSPLKEKNLGPGVDMVIVRENSEGLYLMKGKKMSERKAVDESVYTRKGVERLLEYAFTLAEKRGKRITSVDKANVLATSRFWRKIFEQKAGEHKGVEAQSLLVDAFSAYLVRCPHKFDVVATENMFGDIVSDEAAEIAGSLGLCGSLNLNPGKHVVAEATHGSAPDIAGKGVANPVGMIMACGYMMEELGQAEAGNAIKKAVEKTLESGVRTKDIGGTNSTREVGSQVCRIMLEEV